MISNSLNPLVERTFAEVFSVISSSKSKIKNKDYLGFGKIPVVDQGKSFIAGYANQGSVIKNIPLTVFGDHTRAVKFIDFPFIPGADGTKLLVANDKFNRLYAHYLMENLHIPSNGYSRHMSILKESVFKVHISLEEQRKIAACLSTWDKAIDAHDRLIVLKEEQFRGALKKIIATGSPTSIECCSECLDNKRKPLNKSQRSKIQGNVPYYGATGVVDFINDHMFEETLVLLAEDGGPFSEFQTKEQSQLISGKSWVNNHAHVIKGDNILATTPWIYYSLLHKDLKGFINGSTRMKLNKSDMLKVKINLPSLATQRKMVLVLDSFKQNIFLLKKKRELLKVQKNGLMQQLLS